MAAFNFQARFVIPIELGDKQQTIRRPRKDGWTARRGMMLQLQAGDRFHPRRIGLARCLNVGAIHLRFDRAWVRFEGTYGEAQGVTTLTAAKDLDAFAVRDGFQDFADMAAFWRATHDSAVFTGVRTLWGPTFAGPLDPPPAELAD